MNNVRLVWRTNNAQELIMEMARVSSDNPASGDAKLLRYLLKHGHYSPFEMANMCVEVSTSRAISAQIIRHRSFSFQEFSQRYAECSGTTLCPARRQDEKNRQNSFDDLPEVTKGWWLEVQRHYNNKAQLLYKQALQKGIAKESARMILPLSANTKIYMNGNLRSWIHYLNSRCDKTTQLEHRHIAENIAAIFNEEFPLLANLWRK